MNIFTFTHPIPRAHLEAFETIADTFGCALDIHAPEDMPTKELQLTWVIEEDERTWLENAITATSEEHKCTAPAFNWSEVPQNVDWQAKVAADFPPLSMGRFYITRNNETVPEGQIGLAIPANQAFGSGEHATTAECLSLFEHLFLEGETPSPLKTLDMGAGSGLLAMAAAKIYPQSLHVATDIDEDSVRICAENCADNDVPQIVCAAGDGFHLPEVQNNAPFNLVFANILMNPLIEMAEDLVNSMADGAVTILSGFTPEQFPNITETYTKLGLTPLTHTERTQDTSASRGIPSQWVAAAFKKA